MFSGIVEEVGTVISIQHKTNIAVLCVKAKKVIRGVSLGDSIAVNGVCLTVTKFNKNMVTFDMIKETLEKTSLGQLKKNDSVNLERALKANGRINGHMVSGHIDGVVTLKKIIDGDDYTEFRFTMKKEFSPYLVPKGSVCLDGISLTVGEVKATYFSVYLIPFTKKETTFGGKKQGDKVNIETDILAKYIVKQYQPN